MATGVSMPSLIPPNETERIAAVRRYDILDTPPDGAFDRVTSIASRLLSVPISIVSIVDADRIWFKSHHGLDVTEIGRDPGLCASAILHDGPWVVQNAAVDPRTLTNPLVAGEFGLRFYAGVPLRTSDGYNLGTLCVIDKEPRELTEDEVTVLEDLAMVVMDELELRLSARRAIARETAARDTAQALASTLQESLLPPHIPSVPGVRIASRYHVAFADRVGGDFYDVIPTDGGLFAVIGDSCGKGAKAAASTAMARWTIRTSALNDASPASALATLNDVSTRAQADPERYVTVGIADVRLDEGGADLTVALGGHPHPLVLRADGIVEPVGRTAPIVGWRPEIAFHDVTTRLNRGDALILFTDGLQEAIDRDDATALNRTLAPMAGFEPDAIAEALMGVIGDDVRDDAAFLVIAIV